MDQSLDEILAARKSRGDGQRGPRGSGRRRGDRRDDYPRDGIRKNTRDEPRKLDDEWVHDKFEENGSRRSRMPRGRQDYGQEDSEAAYESRGVKIRVDNIHYELTEEDLMQLFERIGPVTKLDLLYDRAGRSEGTAYVTYESHENAKNAVAEFDGANAKGQPIKLAIMPSGPSRRGRNAFDGAMRPGAGRSLADRISRARSYSPQARDRALDDEAARKGIDRYVPGQKSRSRSPLPRRREGGRRPGDRPRGRGERSNNGGERRGDGGGRQGRGGRTKKTQEELDAEMADYFGGGSAAAPAVNESGSADNAYDDDTAMIE